MGILRSRQFSVPGHRVITSRWSRLRMRCFTVDVSVSIFQRMSFSAFMRYFRGAAILTRHLKPLDYALTCAGVAAAAPVIGRYLEPLGTLVAVGAWVRRNAPGSAAWLNGAAGQVSGRRRIPPKAGAAGPYRCRADRFGRPCLPVASWPAPARRAPFLRARGLRSRYLYRSSVRYGQAPQQVLDVWRRRVSRSRAGAGVCPGRRLVAWRAPASGLQPDGAYG